MISQIFLALENYSYVGEIKDFSTAKRPVISEDTNRIIRVSLNTRYCGIPYLSTPQKYYLTQNKFLI
jgi:hypothetical protein